MARAGINRAALTKTALDLIDEAGVRGYDSLTLAGVAARLGVSGPSLYKHVESLADLRRDVTIASVQELTRLMSDASVGRAGEEAVVAVIEATRAYAKRHPGRYLALQHAENPDDPADARLVDAASESVAVIAGALRAYGFGPDQRIDAIRALRAAIHGFVLLELDGCFRMSRELDGSFAVLTRMLLTGLDDLRQA